MKRDPSNPTLIPIDQHRNDVTIDDADEKSDELAFMRAQESSMRKFWVETAKDDL